MGPDPWRCDGPRAPLPWVLGPLTAGSQPVLTFGSAAVLPPEPLGTQFCPECGRGDGVSVEGGAEQASCSRRHCGNHLGSRSLSVGTRLSLPKSDSCVKGRPESRRSGCPFGVGPFVLPGNRFLGTPGYVGSLSFQQARGCRDPGARASPSATREGKPGWAPGPGQR